jgi:hypothetical protein
MSARRCAAARDWRDWGNFPLTGGPTKRGVRLTSGPQWHPGPTRQRCTRVLVTRVGFVGRARLAGGSGPQMKFDYLVFPKGFSIPHRSRKKSRKILTDLWKLWNFPGGRLGYLAQLLYWTLWPKVNGFQMKIGIQIWGLNLKGIRLSFLEFDSNPWFHSRLEWNFMSLKHGPL